MLISFNDTTVVAAESVTVHGEECDNSVVYHGLAPTIARSLGKRVRDAAMEQVTRRRS